MQTTSDTCRLVAARNKKHESGLVIFVLEGEKKNKQTALCNHNNPIASRQQSDYLSFPFVRGNDPEWMWGALSPATLGSWAAAQFLEENIHCLSSPLWLFTFHLFVEHFSKFSLAGDHNSHVRKTNLHEAPPVPDHHKPFQQHPNSTQYIKK